MTDRVERGEPVTVAALIEALLWEPLSFKTDVGLMRHALDAIADAARRDTLDQVMAMTDNEFAVAAAEQARQPLLDMPDGLTVNGHLFVHVAACPCPRIQAEVQRLSADAAKGGGE